MQIGGITDFYAGRNKAGGGGGGLKGNFSFSV